MIIDLFGAATRQVPEKTYQPRPYQPVKFDRREREVIAQGMRRVAKERRRVWTCERSREASKIEAEAERFCNCGLEFIHAECAHDRMKFTIKTSCKSRICPECCQRYYREIRDALLTQVRSQWSAKRRGYIIALVTITATSKRYGSDLPDRDGIARLYRESSQFLRMYFGKYRGVRTKAGKVREDRKHYRGAGAIAVLEIGNDNNNAHVHALVYTPILTRPMIASMSAEWHRITGDSWNIDVKALHNPRHAVNYVLKYITKVPTTDSYDRIARYAVMIKGSRRIRATGVFYNQILKRKLEKLKAVCPYCGGKIYFTGIHLQDEEAEGRRQELFPLLQRRARDKINLKMPLFPEMFLRGFGQECENMRCKDLAPLTPTKLWRNTFGTAS
jgi:hypothetical protein